MAGQVSAPLFSVSASVVDSARRRCAKCRESRPLADFYIAAEQRASAKKGRRITYPCRYCRREYDAARMKPRRDMLDAIKVERGCADCGIRSTHPEIYDFDHVEGDKSFGLADVWRGTEEDALAEVAKCEVVCANCHRIRTRAREHPAFGRDRSAR